jgi:Transposase IS116/IS110/IS902 family
MEGKHGSVYSQTEVPRAKLVRELRRQSGRNSLRAPHAGHRPFSALAPQSAVYGTLNLLQSSRQVLGAEGRDFAVWLGLVPKQTSTGDRTILGMISKRVNRYLRVMSVQAA